MFKKTLQQKLQELKQDKQIIYWHEIEAKNAKTEPFPEWLDMKICHGLRKRGISELYCHQKEALESSQRGDHFVTVTPTASGKSLCYHLPVLTSFLKDASSRALYLFPTKALAQDQMAELNEMISDIGVSLKCHTYDGDTAPQIRSNVRQSGNVVITNPDMLHSAILPHHTKWVAFFERLDYIVIDELHTYRGVFGSHVANVIARLKRICAYYGSNPTFICTSATIANPKALAETLVRESFHIIDQNGAPSGKKHFLFYNPPVVNEPLQIRQSAMRSAQELAEGFLREGIQTILFARSRVRVELILTKLQQMIKHTFGKKTIAGYRGGYLPNQRREIEKGLRSGEIIGVVSTNALELGVDIGQLEVCILTGYPGSIASAWQQAGRAGRRQNEAAIIMVASSSPIDQYIMNHPEYFFNRNPETARVNPLNLIIYLDHLKCAAYELPFQVGDQFIGEVVDDYLMYLTEKQVLLQKKDRWYWMTDAFPAHGISLRSASQENVVIIDQSDVTTHKVIGEMDRFSAMTLLHDEAIYLHQGIQFQVEYLDWDEKKAFVREVKVDYFTDANLAVSLTILEEDAFSQRRQAHLSYGDVSVTGKVTIFKKIRLTTMENIGSGPVHLPEEEMHTSGMWVTFPAEFAEPKEIEDMLMSFATLLHHVAPLHLMCERSDIHVTPQVKADVSGKPTVFIYDAYPGGIGLAKEVYDHLDTVLDHMSKLITSCLCEQGCPACVGEVKEDTLFKKKVITLISDLQRRA
ncbi:MULTISPECIES: DEAD/DEAH box helicase [Shouchella]|uniref:DEAD/DEAH box helicase n=2 Tax=Shouchella TaxID=2893057 RepID=A0ABY7W4H0_9BACI|nr:MULTISPECIES: DEAD/DEAH box helicase [Shouchella]MED4126996.1 DEAD/DEAH box helicase [Shouchella miscanthi]WDF03486.1 DEAD/DEAH box helicase [Shouchella hunanensis]GAF23895.1 ATP-dependent RNA helicase [Bacillus sp. JCM 19047]